MKRHPKVDWSALDEVYFGCANQAGEDNRNVARMALLLAGLPDSMPGITVNRLCASGLNAVGLAAQGDPRRRDRFRHRRRRRIDDARAARHGQGAARRSSAAPRDRGHHHRLALHQSADEAAVRRRCDAGDRPRTSPRIIRSRARTRTRSRCARSSAPRKAQAAGFFAEEIVPVRCRAARPGRSPSTRTSTCGPTPRSKALAKLKPFVRNPGTITAGNASGVNDGAAAMIIASEAAAKKHGLTPLCAHHRHGVGRRAAARHGHRPGAVDAEADGAATG